MTGNKYFFYYKIIASFFETEVFVSIELNICLLDVEDCRSIS